MAAIVRAILLDAGGTLLRERTSRAAIYADAARHHGFEVDESAAAAAMRAALATLPLRVDGAFRYSRPWFRRFIADVFARLGVAAVPKALEEELFERFASAATFTLFDDVEPALDALARRGLRLAVVSNWTPALPRLLGALRIGARFETVVVSAIEQVEKPDPALFRIALERMKVAASEALHVGDHPELDVAGARAAGLRALLLDRTGTAADDAAPCTRITSLSELPRLVGPPGARGGG
jgi:putative hydrolase of the HAD superfamily